MTTSLHSFSVMTEWCIEDYRYWCGDVQEDPGSWRGINGMNGHSVPFMMYL